MPGVYKFEEVSNNALLKIRVQVVCYQKLSAKELLDSLEICKMLLSIKSTLFFHAIVALTTRAAEVCGPFSDLGFCVTSREGCPLENRFLANYRECLRAGYVRFLLKICSHSGIVVFLPNSLALYLAAIMSAERVDNSEGTGRLIVSAVTRTMHYIVLADLHHGSQHFSVKVHGCVWNILLAVWMGIQPCILRARMMN